jgi:hypothetical protein
MRAYGELVKSIAASLDDFAKDNVSDDHDHLDGDPPRSHLAKAVRMGINRIVVTDGTIKAKVPPEK